MKLLSGNDRSTSELSRRLTHLALGLILLLALGIRLWRLDAQSLWYDEGWSVHLAQSSLRLALAQIGSAGHTHPPGYYLLLMVWVRSFGSSVVAVRALSVLLGVLNVAMVYWLAHLLFDDTTGLLAALLLCLSPAHIIYSQETRMYALLAASLTGLLALYYQSTIPAATWKRRHWVALVVLEIVAVYSHFFAFLALASMAIYLLARLWRSGRGEYRPLLTRWVLSQGVVFLAFLPWLPTAIRRTLDHTALAAQPPRAAAYVQEIWSFLMGGHIALLGREPLYARLALLCLVLTAVLAVGLVVSRRVPRGLAFLLMQIVVPLLLVWILMRVRPGFHPRYVLFALSPLLVVLASEVASLSRCGTLGIVGAVLVLFSWLAPTGLAARALLTDSYYARDDARVAAALLDESLPAGTLVLVDNDDWALRYYLKQSRLDDRYLLAEDLADDDLRPLLELLENRPDAVLLKWHQGENDRRGLLPYILERQGRLVERKDFPGYSAFHYSLDHREAPTSSQRVNVNFEQLRLIDATVESVVPADGAIAVSLTWKPETGLPDDYKTALSLIDERGRVLVRQDSQIVDRIGSSTAAWVAGQRVISYDTVRLPPGIPPLEYELQLEVYAEPGLVGLDLLDKAGAPAGKAFALARIELAPAVSYDPAPVKLADMDMVALSPAARVADNLDLLARSIPTVSVSTGETLLVRLAWHHGGSGPLRDYWPQLRLMRNGRTLARQEGAPVYGQYPTSWWASGETVLEWRDLLVPVDLEPGEATLQIQVQGEPPVSLGVVQIKAVSREFRRPVPQVPISETIGGLELVGYDLGPSAPTAGEPISLTLYWRAWDRTTSSYKVFTHLLDQDGRLLAQHDGAPGRGKRPTTGWVAGEYITDRHRMTWIVDGYRGETQIEVGLYNPLTGQRLLTPAGHSQLFLPGVITIE